MATNNSVNTTLSGQTGTGSFAGSAGPTFTGTLTMATPFTLGATSVTSTGTQLNLLNGLTVVPINKVVSQVFTSNGTYTPTTGMVYCIIECVGGGGAGGGGVTTGGSNCSGGGGGGSGSYSRLIATAATIGASKAVTIGAAGLGSAGAAGGNGGDTSVGTLCIGKGGGGGNAGANGGGAFGGTGGVSGTGDVTASGTTGGFGIGSGANVSITSYGGNGGDSIFGSGGKGSIGASAAGNAANLYGGGGGGGTTNSSAQTSGGAGAVGVAIITEFLSA